MSYQEVYAASCHDAQHINIRHSKTFFKNANLDFQLFTLRHFHCSAANTNSQITFAIFIADDFHILPTV